MNSISNHNTDISNKQLSNYNRVSGFTIIEVLIVLAIAGLILIIVFLAVPALQRNSRNTQYRAEATRFAAVTQEFINNNSGVNPGVSNCSGVPVPPTASTQCNWTGAGQVDASRIYLLANAKNDIALRIEAQAATNTAPSLLPSQTFIIVLSAKCPTPPITVSSGTVALQAGATKQIASLYAIEDNAGNAVVQCV